MSAACLHCGELVSDGVEFCCRGCAGAFDLIKGLGLGRYYERRAQIGVAKAAKPEEAPVAADPSAWIVAESNGTCRLSLMVDGSVELRLISGPNRLYALFRLRKAQSDLADAGPDVRDVADDTADAGGD